MLKEVPEFPADIVRKYRHQMIVASAIHQADGKLEQVAVRQSPEHQVAEPLVEALQHWLFEPGKIDGKPVALNFLLGIPGNSPRGFSLTSVPRDALPVTH
jgi:hypothetical protein